MAHADGARVRIGFGPEDVAASAEHLGLGVELDVTFEPDHRLPRSHGRDSLSNGLPPVSRADVPAELPKRGADLERARGRVLLLGTTYLALDRSNQRIPPLVGPGIRSCVAGAILMGWSGIRRGWRRPTAGARARPPPSAACCSSAGARSSRSTSGWTPASSR